MKGVRSKDEIIAYDQTGSGPPDGAQVLAPVVEEFFACN